MVQVAAPAQVRWSDKPFDGALAEASQAKGFVMVDFFTTWCAPCKVLDATAWQDEGLAKTLQEHHVVALRLDAEKEGMNLAKRFAVRGYPTVLLLNGKGQELTRFLGARPAPQIAEQFQAVFQDPRTLDDLRQAVKSDPDDVVAAYGLARKLMASASDPNDRMEGLRLLAEVVQRDEENIKGVGAKALLESVTLRLQMVCGYADRLVRGAFAARWPPDYVYPDVFMGKPDTETAKLHVEAGKAMEAFYRRVETEAGEELIRAAEALRRMKGVEVDAAPLAKIESQVVGDAPVPASRRLCEGYYLLLGQASSDANALNNAAWYLYTAQSHLDAAESFARKALAAAPGDVNARDTLAHILFTTGRGPEAFEMERMALSEAKASGDEASIKIFEGVLESWGKGVADQTLAPE
jgi:thioredoxin-like negative regulator of GroEL